MMHKAWSSIEEVPFRFWRSSVKFQGHLALKIVEFDSNWAFPDCNSSLNSPMAMKCCTKLETAKKRCPIVFQGHPSNFKVTWDKTSPILTQIGRFRTIGRSQLSNPSDLPCCWLTSRRLFIPKYGNPMSQDIRTIQARARCRRRELWFAVSLLTIPFFYRLKEVTYTESYSLCVNIVSLITLDYLRDVNVNLQVHAWQLSLSISDVFIASVDVILYHYIHIYSWYTYVAPVNVVTYHKCINGKRLIHLW